MKQCPNALFTETLEYFQTITFSVMFVRREVTGNLMEVIRVQCVDHSSQFQMMDLTDILETISPRILMICIIYILTGFLKYLVKKYLVSLWLFVNDLSSSTGYLHVLMSYSFENTCILWPLLSLLAISGGSSYSLSTIFIASLNFITDTI